MRSDYNTGAHQGTQIHNCGWCGRRYYDSLLRDCPERPGRKICMYCCRDCPQSIKEGTGEGCRAMPKKKKGKAVKG